MRRMRDLAICLAALVPALAQAPPDGMPAKPPALLDSEPVPIPASQLQVERRNGKIGYPALAQMGRIQGVVRVRATVGADGAVLAAQALDGPPVLRKPAEAIVWSCQFKPPMVNGVATRIRADLGIPFRSKDGQPSLPEQPVTGFVLHVQTASPSGAPKLEPGFLEKAAVAGLEGMGLAARDPGTADPATTLDLTLTIKTSKPNGKVIAQNLVARASLVADRNLAANEPGKPTRVWFLNRDQYSLGEAEMEGTSRRLLGEVMQALMPTPEGLPRHRKDFDFSQMRVLYEPPAPPYPVLAKLAHIQGAVIVEVVVDPAGVPASTKAIGGPPQLAAVAEDYAMGWRFEPALLDGVPQAARFRLTLTFALH